MLFSECVADGRTSPTASGATWFSGLHDSQSATRSPAVSSDRRPFASPSDALPSTKKQRLVDVSLRIFVRLSKTAL